MAVALVKLPTGPRSDSEPSRPLGPAVGPDVEGFRGHIHAQMFDGYCNVATAKELVTEAVSFFALDQRAAELTLEMELEILHVADEGRLLRDLESMLRQFTGRDGKLDSKERSDAVQLVCRAKSGFAKGLNHEVAEAKIVAFCRQNGVKVKVGIFKWAVP